MGNKIKELLPERIEIVSDGSGWGDPHYVAIFATFRSRSSMGYGKVLFNCSPMENEDILDTDAHFSLLEFILYVFGKSMVSVVTVIRDNCTTNRTLSRRVGRTFVSCHRNRFNLAVQDKFEHNWNIVVLLQSILKKISFQIPAAKLHDFTPLKAELSKNTC